MNARHRIRLSGPWKAEILDSSSHHELAKTHLKAELDGTSQQGGSPFHGNLKLRRSFNLPTGLDDDSVVWLCAEGLPLDAQCQIFLNRQPLDRTGGELTADRQIKFAVTDVLEKFNRLEIVLSCSDAVSPVQITDDAASTCVQATVWLELE